MLIRTTTRLRPLEEANDVLPALKGGEVERAAVLQVGGQCAE